MKLILDLKEELTEDSFEVLLEISEYFKITMEDGTDIFDAQDQLEELLRTQGWEEARISNLLG